MEQSAAYILYQNDFTADKDLLLSHVQFKKFDTLPTQQVISLNSQQAFKYEYKNNRFQNHCYSFFLSELFISTIPPINDEFN